MARGSAAMQGVGAAESSVLAREVFRGLFRLAGLDLELSGQHQVTAALGVGDGARGVAARRLQPRDGG